VRYSNLYAVQQLATGLTVRGTNPVGGGPWGPPGLLYNGCQAFPGGKVAGAWR